MESLVSFPNIDYIRRSSSYQVTLGTLCCHSKPSSDMNKAKKEPEDKNDNIFVRLYENTKEKRRRRQKSETDPKHRKTNLGKKILMDTATCYRMSSTPRL